MGYLLDGSKKDCMGCTACVAVCPSGALSMHPDEQGFLYPVMDDTICVHCHLCERVCPVEVEDKSFIWAEPRCFALRHKDESILGTSQSGGLYSCVVDNKWNIL